MGSGPSIPPPLGPSGPPLLNAPDLPPTVVIKPASMVDVQPVAPVDPATAFFRQLENQEA